MNNADGFDKSELLLIIGSNTTEAHPIIANRMKQARKKGLKIIVIDPRKIDMVKFSDDHLQLRVGSDIALLNAMIHVIIEEKLYSEEFINQYTNGIDQLKKEVEKFTPEFSETITGVPAEQIRNTARAYAGAKEAMIAYTLGITEHHCGVNNVFGISNLALLCGHIGKEGSGIMPLRGQNNVQGAGDMGCLPNMLTGAQPLSDSKVRERFEKAWDVKLPPYNGRTQTQMIEKMEEGQVKALYCIGENPILADVNMDHTKKAFSNLDFLVVQDIFMTETAELADVILPAKSWGEVEGTYTNTERRIQRVRKVVDAQGEAREDWEILCDLSARLGYPMSYESSEQIWEEVRELAPHMYGGMSYQRLEEMNGIQYPCPDENHPGVEYLLEHFHDPNYDGPKASFVPVTYTPPMEEPDEEYPFVLTTGRRYELYNTHTQTKYYPEKMKIKQTEETVDIHPTDAEKLGLENGDVVEVSSRRGKLNVTVKITEQVTPGLVFMSFHFSDVPTNMLTLNEFDPISGTAEYKACAVKIEKTM